ncbi:helix-turn-helix domain-containing protein [Trueperella pyogenes]
MSNLDIAISQIDNYSGSMNIRDQRAQQYSKYVSAELKGLIISRGFTAKNVAQAIGHQQPNMTNWLNAKREMPLSVMLKICEEIGVEPGMVTQRAYDRLVFEAGEWGEKQEG